MDIRRLEQIETVDPSEETLQPNKLFGTIGKARRIQNI